MPAMEIEISFKLFKLDNHSEIKINGNRNKIYLMKGG
jgi:hypothetical protein